jgi:homoserine dehydrogenase
MDDFLCFTSPDHHARFGYESTVGAGTPFIASLLRLEMAGDVVRSMHGTFSGTLGFITSGLDDGLPVRGCSCLQ